MSLKRANVPPQKVTFLKQNYEELLNRALMEDAEKASMYIRPRINRA